MGTLYLCPTPIGNLSDISERVLETLRSVDVIACEDTRTSLGLLTHFDIHKPLISYHKFNEQERSEEIIRRLKGLDQPEEDVALISDAGMPAISDPGQILVRKCHDAGIRVTALPGPCAFVTALALSGLDSRRFSFEGFLPTDKKEREEVLEALAKARGTTIFYEAPHRLKETLKLLSKSAGERPAACVREISKRFEEIRLGTIEELGIYFDRVEPRGEFVILIEGVPEEERQKEMAARFEDLSIEEHMALYQDLPEKDAMKAVAKDRGISKRDVYAALKK
ncbi:MAG: 16S rRNA (cytidine(1402)-2'-O)-methyltransferase [Firmicutes bacterium]|nr:16S rRNA (cytidine(1402)-2'-O)-methyltransferase [Bacillota bacterium]